MGYVQKTKEVLERDHTNYVPKKSGTVAITDKQFDSSL